MGIKRDWPFNDAVRSVVASFDQYLSSQCQYCPDKTQNRVLSLLRWVVDIIRRSGEWSS